jgi:hypothetical protein
MIMLESMLLWVVAGVSVILILQYVLKSPSTPERPEGGLGKKFPVGPRRIKSAFGPSDVSSRPKKTRELPVRQTAYVEPAAVPEVEPIITEAAEPATQPVRKKRTDTMQLMLNKAISERR